jgi:hypothetical protein
MGHDAFAGEFRGDWAAAMDQIGVPDQHVASLRSKNLPSKAILDGVSIQPGNLFGDLLTYGIRLMNP